MRQYGIAGIRSEACPGSATQASPPFSPTHLNRPLYSNSIARQPRAYVNIGVFDARVSGCNLYMAPAAVLKDFSRIRPQQLPL